MPNWPNVAQRERISHVAATARTAAFAKPQAPRATLAPNGDPPPPQSRARVGCEQPRRPEPADLPLVRRQDREEDTAENPDQRQGHPRDRLPHLHRHLGRVAPEIAPPSAQADRKAPTIAATRSPPQPPSNATAARSPTAAVSSGLRGTCPRSFANCLRRFDGACVRSSDMVHHP